MQTMDKCRNNGAVNLLCCLRDFVLYAIRNEWIEKNPFRSYKMKIDKNGALWIHKPREKASVMSRVPVLPSAAALLEKYRDDANCQARGKLLPVPSNQKTDSNLKELTDICGIRILAYCMEKFDKFATTESFCHLINKKDGR